MITGASAGIGAATAVALAAHGFDLLLGARRLDALEALAEDIRAHSPIKVAVSQLDVTDPASVSDFASEVEVADVLVNNAGLALGRDRIESLDEGDVRTMWETNVEGLIRVTRAFLPGMRGRATGHIVNVGSIAGFETYAGGGGYTASKHAVRAITRTLRIELLGTPIRVTEVSPGLVETEFSIVRFAGDRDRASQVYEGIDPLTAEDVADAIAWAVTRPPHVNIDEIVLKPVAQANSTAIARDGAPLK
ncbi:MAG TPA: SDR family NAD(P)-dependent oxidoreductase [Actinomycetota bacterium]|nr:SDR family NAD(P)-dependent oxidoreductase [Actinomycetota bacterium]